MAMTMEGSGNSMADINVTPMIDILLVLLIIFMVIVPMTPKGLDALLPQPSKPEVQPAPMQPVVVQVFGHSDASPTYKINNIDVSHSELLAKLTEIYANRAERVMFVKSDDDVNFAYIADVIDISKAANVDHVGLMTPKVQAGL
jgi:biopolymer transport protein TolR